MSNRSRPPPIQLLPAFEVCARLLSFSRAADELHLTTSAISQQIKQLEGHFGQPLFRRLTRGVELTEAGEQFAAVASATLATYRQGYAESIHRFSKPSLRVGMTPLIAHEFILPRLETFQSNHPDVGLSIETSMTLVNFESDAVDAAIRVGNGQWAGLDAWPLCDLEAVLLATPALLTREPIAALDDLARHTLIRRRTELFGWDELAAQTGLANITGRSELFVDSDLAALHAAEQGLGVALSFLPSGMSRADRWTTQRVKPALPAIAIPLQAWFVCRAGSSKNALLRDTFEWVHAQINPPGQEPLKQR